MEHGFEIFPLGKSHKKDLFSCGVGSLDRYLKKQAGQDSRKKVAVTYVLSEKASGKIAGYYTLSAAAMELAAVPEPLQKKLPMYPNLPATLLGRLAIDASFQSLGWGEMVLVDALKRALTTSAYVASFAVVVDAINERARAFYQKYGFLDLPTTGHRLFMPMKQIAGLFS